MNSLFWNCQGLGNSRTVRILGDLVRTRKPDFLFLYETLVGSNKINKLCSKLSFNDCFSVDSNGRS